MASDLEQLVLSISADTRQIQRALKRLEGDTNSSTRKIEKQFADMGRRINSQFSGLGGTFARSFVGAFAAGFSVNAAKELIDTATRIKNALSVAGLSGEELTRVYDRLYASAQKNAAPIESLVTLYGRAAIVQKELGVSTEELLSFTNHVSLALRVAGTDASTASGALLQLSQALGSGVVRAEEFNSVLEGALPIAQAAAAGIQEAGGSVAKLRSLVVDGKVSSEAFFRAFEAGSSMLEEKVGGSELTISQAFVRLQNVLVDVATRFDDSVHASRTLATMIDGTLIPAIEELGGIFTRISNGPIGDFYDWLGKTIDRVVQLSADLGAMTGLDKIGGQPYIGQGRIQDRINGAFVGTTYTTPKSSRTGTEITVDNGTLVKPITLDDYPVTGGKGKKGGRGGYRATADDRFTESLQDIRDRTAALKAEQETLGATFLEQQKRSVSLDLEQEALRQVREEARRKGDQDWQNAQLSPKQVKQIDEVSDAYARQADELRKAQEAQDLQRDVLKGALSDFRQAFEDGKITTQEWGDIALNVLDKVIDKIEDDLVDAIMNVNQAGSSGGSIFDWITKGIGALFGGGVSADPWAGLRLAEGGKVSGPGGPTGDKIPAMLSNGEHVTRAAMAKKYGPLLDAINADRLPKFADGGFVSPQIVAPRMPTLSPTRNSTSPVVTVAPTISVDARGTSPGVGPEVEAAVKKAMSNMTPAVVKALKQIRVQGIPV